MTKTNPGEKAFRKELNNRRTFERLSRRPPLTYAAAIASFAETEDCSPVQAVAAHKRCRQISRQFSKTPEQVANDINRVYLDSYKHG